MISEVDIRDWQDAVAEGYRNYMADNAHLEPYSNEVWKAASHWAFSFLLKENEND